MGTVSINYILPFSKATNTKEEKSIYHATRINRQAEWELELDYKTTTVARAIIQGSLG